MNHLLIKRFPPLGYAGNEAMNTLCTNLSFLGEDVKKIMITSSHASEGKSHLSMNIMRSMAKIGNSVVLVDADLRRSVVTSRYGIQFQNAAAPKGLAHYLAGKADMDEVVYQTNLPNAYMVPIGRTVSNPLPLLNSSRFGYMLDELAKRFSYVLVDVPPVGLVIDGGQIAKFCDGTLIAVGYNAVRRQELINVKEQLEQTECPIIGAVLNMVEYDSYLNRKYNTRYYNATYEQDEKEVKRKTTSSAKPKMRKTV